MPFTSWARDNINNKFFHNTSWTHSATVYFGLLTGDPGAAGDQASELTGASYARVAASFTASSSGSTTNAADTVLPTASADWLPARYGAIFDAVSAGNMICYEPLPAPLTVPNAEHATFLAGSIVIMP